MDYYIQTFLSMCLLFSIVGAVVWLIYMFSALMMFVFPYALAVVLGALFVVAIIAWRRSRGY